MAREPTKKGSQISCAFATVAYSILNAFEIKAVGQNGGTHTTKYATPVL